MAAKARAVARNEARRAKHAAARERVGMTVTALSVVTAAESVTPNRDGLEWLKGRGELTPVQLREAEAYRADYEGAAEAGVTIKSALADPGAVRATGVTPLGPAGLIIRRQEAQARLYRKRHVVLGGEVSIIEVLDAVCGRRLTLVASLAGRDARRAGGYLALLKAGLNMLANGRV
jgi:hypothetical protein